jgi:hypothetical protein
MQPARYIGATVMIFFGVTETMSPDQKLFGRDQLQELLKRKIDLNWDNLFSDIEVCLSVSTGPTI